MQITKKFLNHPIKGLFPGEIPYTVWQVNHNEKKGATKNTVAAHIYRNFGTHGSTPEPFGMSLSWSKGLRKQTAVRGTTRVRWATQLWSVLMLFWKWWKHPSYPIISLNPPPFKSSNKELLVRFLWWFHDLNVPFIGHFVGKFPKPQTSPLRDRFVSLKKLGHLHTVQKKWLARKVVCFQSMGWRLHTKNYIHLIKSHHLFAWYVGIYSNRYTGRAGTSWKHSRRISTKKLATSATSMIKKLGTMPIWFKLREIWNWNQKMKIIMQYNITY